MCPLADEEVHLNEENQRKFSLEQQNVFETNERINESAIKLPAMNPMLFTFAVLVSGSSFTRAEEMFSYVTNDFPDKTVFYEFQKIIEQETERLLDEWLMNYQLEVIKKGKKLLHALMALILTEEMQANA